MTNSHNALRFIRYYQDGTLVPPEDCPTEKPASSHYGTPLENPDFLQIAQYISPEYQGVVALLMDDLGLVPVDIKPLSHEYGQNHRICRICPNCPRCPTRWDKGQRDTKQRKSYEYADTANRQNVPQFPSADAELERHRVRLPFRRMCRFQGQHAELQRHGHHHLSGQFLLFRFVP